MAKQNAKKVTAKKATPKKKKTVQKENTVSKTMSRKDQLDSSKLIMIGTAIVILLVLGYILTEYFMV